MNLESEESCILFNVPTYEVDMLFFSTNYSLELELFKYFKFPLCMYVLPTRKIIEESIFKTIQNKTTSRVEKAAQSIKWLFWCLSVNKTWKLGAKDRIT